MTDPSAGRPDAHPSQEDIEQLLRQIGIEETVDPIGEASLPASTGEMGSSSRDTMFVRGASKGGSPMLNFVTRAITVVGVAIIVAGGIAALRALASRVQSAAPPSVPGQIATGQVTAQRCDPSRRGSRAQPALANAVAALAGRARLSPEVSELNLAGATVRPGPSGYQIVEFTPPVGALTLVQQARSGDIHRITVSFSEPRPLCEAVAALGLLPNPVEVALSPHGDLQLLGGDPDEWFSRGGKAKFRQTTDGRIDAVQLDSPVR